MPSFTRDYESFVTGEVAGSATAVVLPTIPCRMVNIKAQASNVGKVYVGITGVTVPGGTTDTTSGWPLAAGEETGFLPLANLNLAYIICDNAGDDISYLAVS